MRKEFFVSILLGIGSLLHGMEQTVVKNQLSFFMQSIKKAQELHYQQTPVFIKQFVTVEEKPPYTIFVQESSDNTQAVRERLNRANFKLLKDNSEVIKRLFNKKIALQQDHTSLDLTMIDKEQLALVLQLLKSDQLNRHTPGDLFNGICASHILDMHKLNERLIGQFTHNLTVSKSLAKKYSQSFDWPEALKDLDNDSQDKLFDEISKKKIARDGYHHKDFFKDPVTRPTPREYHHGSFIVSDKFMIAVNKGKKDRDLEISFINIDKQRILKKITIENCFSLAGIISKDGDFELIISDPDKTLSKKFTSPEYDVGEEIILHHGKKLLNAGLYKDINKYINIFLLEDGTIQIYDRDKQQDISSMRYPHPNKNIRFIPLSNNTHVVLHDKNHVTLINMASKEIIPVSKSSTQQISEVTLSDDEKQICYIDDKIHVYSIDTQDEQVYNQDLPSINSVAFAPDNKTLAYGYSNKNICIIDTETQQTLKLATPKDVDQIALYDLSFTKEGSLTANAGNKIITFQNKTMLAQLEEFKKAKDWLGLLTFLGKENAQGEEVVQHRYGFTGLFDKLLDKFITLLIDIECLITEQY